MLDCCCEAVHDIHVTYDTYTHRFILRNLDVNICDVAIEVVKSRNSRSCNKYLYEEEEL